MPRYNLRLNNKQNGVAAPLWLWLLVRLATIVVASLAYIYEVGLNRALPVGRLILAPWYNYDAAYYVQIVSNGYLSGEITSGFHPLYPWLATVAAIVFRNPLLALMFTSSVAGLLFVIAFYHLGRMDLTPDRSWIATALVILWPTSVAIFAPYTEALFLLLATCCLLAARQRRFFLAGLVGGLAALTRQHGILLAIPLAWEVWENSNRNLRKAFANWATWFSVALVPSGYALWIVYRAVAIDDARPDFSSPQSFIFSVMVSKTAYGVFKDQEFVLPWVALWRAIRILFTQNLHWSAYGDVLLASVFIGMFVLAWRHLRTSYRLYSLSVVLIALSYHTGSTIGPYISLPRHMLPAFPIFIGVAAAYRFRNPKFVLGVAGVCQMLVLCCYVWETWVL